MSADPAAVSEPTTQSDLIGIALLNSATLNKGTAFTETERRQFGLNGLLPPRVETLEEQVQRAYKAFKNKQDDLERHIYLRALQDTNEVLLYRLLLDHLEEVMPIVYTPVVAQACKLFSRIYRRPRGLILSYPMRNVIPELLRNRPNREVDVILATDGERVLGIGDQGVGGMGISIGKLSLHTLIGGIHPARTLPIVLDVGTNNRQLLDDPEYLGWHHERISEEEYFEFIGQFVSAVKQELPNTLLHCEDFSTVHARQILNQYEDEMLIYNDDLQGTAAVSLGAVLSALSKSGQSLKDQRIVFLGAGSAVGVADYLRAEMVAQGLSEQEAWNRFWMLDKNGLLHTRRTDLKPDQFGYAQSFEEVRSWPLSSDGNIGLHTVVEKIKPTILFGLSTVGGAFTEQIVRAMAANVERPIIFPLSNPTDASEATAEDLIRWTEGRALVATGSPFPPVSYDGRQIPISQCNNIYIFPAVSLGVTASRARRVTEEMVRAAGSALANIVSKHKDPFAPLLPPLEQIRSVAVEIAVTVGETAQAAGLAPRTSQEELRQRVIRAQWTPEYSVLT